MLYKNLVIYAPDFLNLRSQIFPDTKNQDLTDILL